MFALSVGYDVWSSSAFVFSSLLVGAWCLVLVAQVFLQLPTFAHSKQVSVLEYKMYLLWKKNYLENYGILGRDGKKPGFFKKDQTSVVYLV